MRRAEKGVGGQGAGARNFFPCQTFRPLLFLSILCLSIRTGQNGGALFCVCAFGCVGRQPLYLFQWQGLEGWQCYGHMYARRCGEWQLCMVLLVRERPKDSVEFCERSKTEATLAVIQGTLLACKVKRQFGPERLGLFPSEFRSLIPRQKGYAAMNLGLQEFANM